MGNKTLITTLAGAILLASSVNANVKYTNLESRLTPKVPSLSEQPRLTPRSNDYHIKEAVKSMKRAGFLREEKALKESINNNPNNAETYFHIGLLNLKHPHVSYQQDKIEEAIEYFNKSLELNSNNPKTLLELGNCYYHKAYIDFNKKDIDSEKTNLGKALINYEKVAKLDSKSANAHKSIGIVYLSMFDDINNSEEYLKKAEESFIKAIDLDINMAHGYFGLSKVYHKRGKQKQAIIEIEKAIKLFPDSQLYQNTLEEYQNENH